MSSTNFKWSPPAARPNSAARSAATSTWSPRAAPTPCMATSMATSAISASTPPTLCPTPRCPLTQAQYGASLGGPIVHDRTFYFANFEQRDLNQSGLITISPANVAAINARLAGRRLPGPADLHRASIPTRSTTRNFFAKVDHQFSAARSVQHPLQPLRRRTALIRAAPAA